MERLFRWLIAAALVCASTCGTVKEVETITPEEKGKPYLDITKVGIRIPKDTEGLKKMLDEVTEAVLGLGELSLGDIINLWEVDVNSDEIIEFILRPVEKCVRCEPDEYCKGELEGHFHYTLSGTCEDVEGEYHVVGEIERRDGEIYSAAVSVDADSFRIGYIIIDGSGNMIYSTTGPVYASVKTMNFNIRGWSSYISLNSSWNRGGTMSLDLKFTNPDIFTGSWLFVRKYPSPVTYEVLLEQFVAVDGLGVFDMLWCAEDNPCGWEEKRCKPVIIKEGCPEPITGSLHFCLLDYSNSKFEPISSAKVEFNGNCDGRGVMKWRRKEVADIDIKPLFEGLFGTKQEESK